MDTETEKKIEKIFLVTYSSQVLLKLAVEHRATAIKDKCEQPDEEMNAAILLEDCANKLEKIGM
jgi:hypothetical protein